MFLNISFFCFFQNNLKSIYRTQRHYSGAKSSILNSGETVVEDEVKSSVLNSGETVVEDKANSSILNSGETVVEDKAKSSILNSGETVVEDDAKSSILNSGETVVEDKIYLRPQGNLLRCIDNKTLEDR